MTKIDFKIELMTTMITSNLHTNIVFYSNTISTSWSFWYPISRVIRQNNYSSIPLCKTHKSIEWNKSWSQTKQRRTLTIRGKERINWITQNRIYTELRRKKEFITFRGIYTNMLTIHDCLCFSSLTTCFSSLQSLYTKIVAKLIFI